MTSNRTATVEWVTCTSLDITRPLDFLLLLIYQGVLPYSGFAYKGLLTLQRKYFEEKKGIKSINDSVNDVIDTDNFFFFQNLPKYKNAFWFRGNQIENYLLT